MADTQVRDITIKCTIKGETRHPAAIRMTARVNAYPIVQITHHGGSEAYREAVDVTSGDITRTMGERQNDIYQERDTADASLSIEDGQGGTITFDGLTTSPAYAFSPIGAVLSDVLLPEYALMDSLDYSCYRYASSDIEIASEVGLENSDTIPRMFYDCGEYLKQQWEQADHDQLDESDSLTLKAQEAQHEINVKVKHYFEDLVNNSSEADDSGETPFGWEEVTEALKDDSTTARQRMFALLQSSSGSFFTTVCQFAEEYQCLYVPGWNDVGVLANRNRAYAEPVDYTCQPTRMLIQAGTQGLFPVRYVAVSPSVKTPDIELPQDTDNYYIYPESNMRAGGSAIRNPGPPWLGPATDLVAVDEEGKSMQELSGGFTVSTIMRSISRRLKEIKDSKGLTTQILKDWAKSVYLWQSLGSSTVQMAIPLDVSLIVGTRYRVRNNAGAVLFTGFLQQVEHSVSSSLDNAAATTALSFSHIELPGFELPGKNE